MSKAIAGLMVSILVYTVAYTAVVANMIPNNHGVFAGIINLYISFASMFFALMFGIPAILVMLNKNWGEWWQSLLVGLLIPQLIIFFLLNRNSQVYVLVLHTILGTTNGLILWVMGIFRNPAFTSSSQKFPISIILAPMGIILLIFYLQALESDWAYGCIMDSQLIENSASDSHAELRVLLGDGEEYLSKVNVIEADTIGSCAMGILQPKANLKGSSYLVISTRARPLHCNQICPAKE